MNSEEVDFLSGKPKVGCSVSFLSLPDALSLKKSPLVLVGALATAGVLVGGLVAFKKGNQNASQALMRTRVVFQAATVAISAWCIKIVRLPSHEHAFSQCLQRRQPYLRARPSDVELRAAR